MFCATGSKLTMQQHHTTLYRKDQQATDANIVWNQPCQLRLAFAESHSREH